MWAGPRSTIRKIARSAPVIRRLRNSMKTAALTPPFSLIMNRISPRAVIAEIRLMLWRAPVASTTGVSPRVMIRAHVGGIAKENLRFFPLRKGLDPRILLLEPLLYQSLVALLRTV